MKNLGTSILILCLNERIAASLAKGLADCLGLHFASAKEIVSYDLFDPEAILQKCGKTYFRQREKASLKGLSNYEDSVIFVNYDLFINNQTIFKRIHPKVYLKLAKRKLDKKYDAIITLGAIIRGATSHYDFVAAELSKGIANVSLSTGVPVLFGVLTTENITATAAIKAMDIISGFFKFISLLSFLICLVYVIPLDLALSCSYLGTLSHSKELCTVSIIDKKKNAIRIYLL